MSNDEPLGGSPRCRYIFTWFEATESEKEHLAAYGTSECKYWIFGLETCPTTGRPHLQGYLNLKKKIRPRQLFEQLGCADDTRVTIRGARGNDEENRVYCSKGGQFVEGGTPSKPGKRTDLDGAIETLKNGGLVEVAEQHSNVFVRHHRGLATLERALKNKPRTEQPCVIWIWGETGVGKTRLAWEIGKKLKWKVYPKMRGKWWDGFLNEEICLFDDFRKIDMEFNELLRITDRYPVRYEVKGDTIWFNSKLIIFTSIFSIESEFANGQEPLQQFNRRVTEEFQVLNWENSLQDILNVVENFFNIE